MHRRETSLEAAADLKVTAVVDLSYDRGVSLVAVTMKRKCLDL